MSKDKRKKPTFDLASLLTGRGAGQSRLSFPPDQVIYPQGSHADAMFYVESGRVKVSVVSPSGKEAVVGIRGEGQFFGARCLIDRRTGTATALTACTLIRVTKAALTRLLREQSDFAVMFTTYLVRQSLNDQESIVDHLTNPAEKRLVRTLLQLANALDDDGPHTISTPINQAVLANMIGTTRSRISFFMNKFKRQGLIIYHRNGQISVLPALRGALLER